METSSNTRSVFSEEAKQLKQFLLDFESEQESQTILKEVEGFLFCPENRWRLKTDDISKSLLNQVVFYSVISSPRDFCTTASKLRMAATFSAVAS